MTGCLFEFVPGGVWELLETAGVWERHGVLPVDGGLLDQCESGYRACVYVWQERARVRAALKGEGLELVE